MAGSSQRKVVLLASNGYSDGNAEAILEYLNHRKSLRVYELKHPLSMEAAHEHRLYTYDNGVLARSKRLPLPFKPPFTYPLDLFVPLRPLESIDLWMGFGPLNTLRGLVGKRLGLVKKVVYNCVDFTPDRFGKGSPVTWVYDQIDRHCCTSSDEIWTLAEAGHLLRMKRLGLPNNVPLKVIPMGAWMDEAPHAGKENFHHKRLIFLGHLIEKQGLQAVIQALVAVKRVMPEVKLDVIGHGPYEQKLRELARSLGLDDIVQFAGFVASHKQIEKSLAEASVAVATYDPEQSSFTNFTDPGKLKAYMAAGLPIVMTDVSPNAKQLQTHAGVELVAYDPDSIAVAILKMFADQESWWQRSQAARRHMLDNYDWNVLLDKAFDDFLP